MAIEAMNYAEVANAYTGPVPAGAETEMTANGFGAIWSANAAAPMEEIVRLGNSYAMRNYTLQNSVNAIPTTTAMVSWWNGSTGASARVLVLDRLVFVSAVADATQANNHTVLWNMQPAGFAKPTASAACFASLSGKGGGTNSATSPPGSNTLLVTGATVVDTGWLPLPTSSAADPSQVGSQWHMLEAKIDGLIVVPSTALFSICVVSPAALNTSVMATLYWHEVPGMVLG